MTARSNGHRNSDRSWRSPTSVGAVLMPPSCEPWRGEVLEGGEDLARAERQAAALVAADGGDAELADEERILAVGLLDAAPARIARQVDHRRQHDLAAAGPRFLGGDGHRALDQRRVPGGAEAERHREVRRLRGDEAVQRLLVEHHGNPEPRVLEHPLLDGVGELGVLARAADVGPGLGSADLAGPRQLSDALAEQRGGAGRDERALGVLQRLEGRPAGRQLRDLLLERHPPEQIGDALGHGARGVLVDRRRLLRRQHRHRCGREGQRRGEAGGQSGGTRGGHVDPISLAVRNSRRQQQTGGDTLPQPQDRSSARSKLRADAGQFRARPGAPSRNSRTRGKDSAARRAGWLARVGAPRGPAGAGLRHDRCTSGSDGRASRSPGQQRSTAHAAEGREA